VPELADYIRLSATIPGWTRGKEAAALAQASFDLPDGALAVEIGAFLGSGTALLAGARKLRGSGKVVCVDPFDGSGDEFSVPVYARVGKRLAVSYREQFDRNIRRLGLREWVEVRQGRATEVAAGWSTPIDLLFMDGDQSYAAVTGAYACWSRFLKPGAILALHNSNPRKYHPSHDGHRRLAEEEVRAPRYADIRLVGTTTFARWQGAPV
jgi:predicted O-methyltransferase YrrM